MDDSSVTQTSIKTVLKQQAYILFYVRIMDTPPTSKSTSTTTTATPAVIAATPTSTHVDKKPTAATSMSNGRMDNRTNVDFGEVVLKPPEGRQQHPHKTTAEHDRTTSTLTIAPNTCPAGINGHVDGSNDSEESDDENNLTHVSDSNSSSSGESRVQGNTRLQKRYAWRVGIMR